MKLTDEQQLIKNMVREFAESEIKPIASAIDKSHRFPAAATACPQASRFRIRRCGSKHRDQHDAGDHQGGAAEPGGPGLDLLHAHRHL